MSSKTSLQNSPTDFNDSPLKNSIKAEKIIPNTDIAEISNEKRDIVATSSYKFLSWREKDRRRRFRDEWKHMWLVIPHGNFEVMCLVCHKVMTQRKLDTIKRHTVRRHTEVLDMDQGERIVLFEKLFLEHNSLKFQQKNDNNCLSDTTMDNGKLDSEAMDLEKILSSDCVSATSSSSLSPSDSRENNSEIFFSKRGKYSRKNIKINIKSNQKVDSGKAFSSKSAVENKSTCNKNSAYRSNFKGPPGLENQSCNPWSSPGSADKGASLGTNKPLQDSLFNKYNGSSCLNFLPPLPLINKCPLCLEDCSQNGTDSNHAFARLMSHIQQKHSDKFPSQIPSFDLNQFGCSAAGNDLLKLQALQGPATTNNSSNYMSISNAISNANLISLLYYQELLRQNVPTNQTPPQYNAVSSDSIYYQATPPSSNSSLFPHFSSPSPQCSLRPSSSMPSGFNLATTSDQLRFDPKTDQTGNNFDDISSGFDKFVPFKRAKFSAESLISEANKQSAFYNPKFNRVDDKETKDYNSVSKLPLGPSIYANSKCKETKSVKEEFNANEDLQQDNLFSSLKPLPDPYNERSLTPKSSAQGNLLCHAMRFGPGQDLVAGLMEYTRRNRIGAGFVMTCCGSLSTAQLRMADSGIQNTSPEVKTVSKHCKIVSLVGSISDKDCHLHISMSDNTGDVIGGHVVGNLIVHTTAEVMLGQMSGVQMHREIDDCTGFRELSFTYVNSGN